MTSRSQPVHRQFTQNIHRLIRQLRVICLYALIFSFLFSSFLSFFWFGCFSSLYNRCCCWFLCDAVCTHRISVCFFESQRHIDIQFSIAHNRIRYVYISIFMYDMLKFPISVVDVVALSARTLSFHLQFEFGVLVALVFFFALNSLLCHEVLCFIYSSRFWTQNAHKYPRFFCDFILMVLASWITLTRLHIHSDKCARQNYCLVSQIFCFFGISANE